MYPPIFNPFARAKTSVLSLPNYIEQNMNWLAKYKLVEHPTYAKGIASVGAMYIVNCYPNIQPNQIQDLIDFASWNCILDDFIEKGTVSSDLSQLTAFLYALKYTCEESNCSNPIDFELLIDSSMTQALVDLKTRMLHWATPSQIHHLMTTLGHFISGLCWESTLRNSGKTPDLNLFCAMRTANAGMYMANAMAQCVNNTCLTIEEQANPILQAMTKCILFVLVLDNDIYSYKKELLSNLPFTNIISVFKLINPDQSEEEAIKNTIELRNQCLLCYQALRKKYTHMGDKMALYFQGLEDIISGNLIFGYTNDRYKLPGEDNLAISFSTTIETPITPPTSIPSILWWWSFLK